MSLYRLQPRAFHLPAGGRDAVSSASSRKGPPRVTTSILLPAILIAALLAWAVMLFNRLVRLRNQVRTAWADIDVQLTRRHDLGSEERRVGTEWVRTCRSRGGRH